jgi:Flp pilus assembly protein CpaB
LKRSNRLVLLVGVFLAVVAFVGIALLLSGNQPGTSKEPAVPTELPTVIAVKDITLGTTVTKDMVTAEIRKVAERKTNAFTSVELVIGQVARRPITNGAQLEPADFASGSGISQLSVPKGLVAMSVSVDQLSGVGTVINNGDYVDMIVGFTGDRFPVVTVNPEDQSVSVVAGLNGTSVKLLLEGMQVLGRLLPPPPAQANGQAAPANPETNLTNQSMIVILGVTQSQAEVIKFAQLDGNMTLVLRSSQDFRDEQGNAIVPPPAGTKGVTLKKLTVDLAVPIPELVEAILPTQSRP